ncbi:MAG: hypothetical protein R3F37_20815 [Candidatus Competibacteraceae bacterium]
MEEFFPHRCRGSPYHLKFDKVSIPPSCRPNRIPVPNIDAIGQLAAEDAQTAGIQIGIDGMFAGQLQEIATFRRAPPR